MLPGGIAGFGPHPDELTGRELKDPGARLTMAVRNRKVAGACLWRLVLALLVICSIVTPVWSTITATPTPPAVALTPAQARQALEVLSDPNKRAQIIQTLQAIAKALPQPTPALHSPIALKPNSLGAAVVTAISGGLNQLGQEAELVFHAAAAIPPLWPWLSSFAGDPAARLVLLYRMARVLLVLGCALIIEWLVRRALKNSLAALESRARFETADVGNGAGANAPSDHLGSTKNGTLLRRLPLAGGHLLLELLAVMAFAVMAIMLMAALIGWEPITAQIIRQIVIAYVVSRATMCFGRFLLSPSHSELRLVRVNDATAQDLTVWLRWITGTAAFGAAAAVAARSLGLSEVDYQAVLNWRADCRCAAGYRCNPLSTPDGAAHPGSRRHAQRCSCRDSQWGEQELALHSRLLPRRDLVGRRAGNQRWICPPPSLLSLDCGGADRRAARLDCGG